MNGPTRTARTDTVRIPRVDTVDLDTTVEFFPVWLLPPVAVTYGTPRRRLRDRRLTGHLAASARSAFYPLAVGCGLILGVTASHL